jgi:hypothetical protein
MQKLLRIRARLKLRSKTLLKTRETGTIFEPGDLMREPDVRTGTGTGIFIECGHSDNDLRLCFPF